MRKFTICLTLMIGLCLPLSANASLLPWNIPNPDGLWAQVQTWFSTPLTTTKDGAVWDPDGAPAESSSSEIGNALDPDGAPSDSEDGAMADPDGASGG